MNPRQFLEEGSDTYYYLEPPLLPYENLNVIERAFRLKDHSEAVYDSLDRLSQLAQEFEGDKAQDRALYRESKREIYNLIEGLEFCMFNFPDLLDEEWFVSFWQTVASATWRLREGRFENNHRSLKGHIHDILAYIPDSQAIGIRGQFRNFFEFYGSDINPHDVPSAYKEDVYEARDHFCLGYYSTALLVLGRAVEKVLLEIGHERKIETLNAFGRERSWDNANFYARKEALKEIQEPMSTGKILNQRQYHEVSVLVDYRNNVAHSEYDDLTKNEALRQINNAFSLLKELCAKLEALRELPDDEIDPVNGQAVN